MEASPLCSWWQSLFSLRRFSTKINVLFFPKWKYIRNIWLNVFPIIFFLLFNFNLIRENNQMQIKWKFSVHRRTWKYLRFFSFNASSSKIYYIRCHSLQMITRMQCGRSNWDIIFNHRTHNKKKMSRHSTFFLQRILLFSKKK